MKEKMNFILMADIIGSSNMQQKMLMVDFKSVVNVINRKAKQTIISPMTITLGDEFQGVIDDLQSALEIILMMEEEIISQQLNFKLRYVLVEGEIDTPINKKIAYEMLGSGLTEARNLLLASKKSNTRFEIQTENKAKTAVINDAFSIYQSIIDNWQLEKDFQLITTFIQFKDYKLVAEKLNKDRSLMWRREKTLKMKEYLSIKNIIKYLAEKNNV